MSFRKQQDGRPAGQRIGDGLLEHSVLLLIFANAGGVANMLFHVAMGRALPPGEYGVLASMLSLAFMFVVPMGAIQNTLAHQTGQLCRDGRRNVVGKVCLRWVRWLLPLGIGVTAATWCLGWPLARFFRLHGPAPLLVVSASVPVCFLLPVFVGILQGGQRFVWMSLAAQSGGVLRLALALAFVAMVPASAVVGLTAHTAAMVAALALAVAGVMRLARGGRSAPHVPVSTRSYFAMSLAGLASFAVLMYADTVLVKHFFHDPIAFGNYARASTIARTTLFLALPVASAMFPKVVARERSPHEHGRILVQAVLLQGAITVAALAMIVCFAGPIFCLVFNEARPPAGTLGLVRILSVAMAPLSLTYLLMNFEFAQNRFMCVWPLAGSAALYVVGIVLFHASLMQVAMVVGVACALSFVSLLAVFRRS